MAKRILLLVIACSMLLAQSAMAEGGQLWKLGGDKGVIKVFLSDFVDKSGNVDVSLPDFKKAIVSALESRRSTKFIIVNSPDLSDVQVSGVVEKLEYLTRGPFNVTPGIETTLLDAAQTMSANYAEMVVKFTVTETKNSKVVWNETVMPYVKEKMTKAESIPLIYARVANHFIRMCFGKPEIGGPNSN